MHLPLGVCVAPAVLTNLISQLPLPFIFLGDLYAKNIPWGSLHTNERGSVVTTASLPLLNTGVPMHHILGSETSSALDLAFYSPELAVHL
jgi:hypothetical protein